MDVMLMSQCPDRATFQMPQDPTVCVPLNRGPLLPCLPSRCMLSFREPGEESPSCLHCRCVPVLRNRLTAVPAWTESVPAARPALATQGPVSCHRNAALDYCCKPLPRDWVECRSSLSPMAPGPRKGARASRPSLGGKDLGGLGPIRTRPSRSALVVQEYRSMVFDALLDSWPLAQSPADLGH